MADPIAPSVGVAAPVATATGIVKIFGETRALDGVDLAVAPGKVTGLVGPDGAGKTTLIRVLAGLMASDEGAVSILEAPPTERLDAIGYMPQRFGLYEDLTVRENLVLYAEMRGLPREAQESVFRRLLEFTDLARFQSRAAHSRIAGGDGARSVSRPPGGQALGRHEAEARPCLRAGEHAAFAAAR